MNIRNNEPTLKEFREDKEKFDEHILQQIKIFEDKWGVRLVDIKVDETIKKSDAPEFLEPIIKRRQTITCFFKL